MEMTRNRNRRATVPGGSNDTDRDASKGFALPYTRLVEAQTGRKSQKRRPIIRSIRALWRDMIALWHEFRVAILLFLFVTVGGGFVYGELYFIARGETIALIDRPYIMLQLMILESPGDAPPEWYLVIFWYLLPAFLVFIVGLGAAEFVHLFFNLDERRYAWRLALASTYRNHIIVFGAGHVGMRVIATLYGMGVDVVVLDNQPDAGVEDALERMDIPLVTEDGRLPGVLEKAGLRHAEAFIACVGNDHVNLDAVMRVRDLNPDIRIVVRMWEDEFSHQIEDFFRVQSVLSSSDLAAPAFAGAALGIDITQTLTIHGVDYSMLRLTVNKGSFLDGQTIGEIQSYNDMDVVLHSPKNTLDVDVQPNRTTVVKPGDTIVIFARHEDILTIVDRNRKQK